jgi:Inner membrane protein CreD
VTPRLGALAFIFLCTSIGWSILGHTIFSRTYNSDPALRARVESSWGSPQRQSPPDASGSNLNVAEHQAGIPFPLEASQVDVSLELEPRQKGLLWYSTYKSVFSGAYVFRNDTDQSRMVTFTWRLPAEKAVYDDLSLTLDRQPLPFKHAQCDIVATAQMVAGATSTFKVSYRSRGLDTWEYNLGDAASQVRDFSLRMNTNFRDIDFPDNTLSPTQKHTQGEGWELVWRYKNLVSGYNIAMAMPAKLQPGPLAGEISYFAPVSLLFFFFVVFLITTLRKIDLHPVNYFFLAAAFFAFHLLLAYLVDHVSIHVAFLISSIVSIALVISYLRLVVGMSFAMREAGIAQLIYLVLFSYAFFFRGFTGLAVTIGAVLTLFVAMQATGRIKWSELFVKS